MPDLPSAADAEYLRSMEWEDLLALQDEARTRFMWSADPWESALRSDLDTEVERRMEEKVFEAGE